MQADPHGFEFFQPKQDAPLSGGAFVSQWEYAHANGLLGGEGHGDVPSHCATRSYYNGTFEYSQPAGATSFSWPLISAPLYDGTGHGNRYGYGNDIRRTDYSAPSPRHAGEEYSVTAAVGGGIRGAHCDLHDPHDGDTTVLDAAAGTDFQGIPWNTMPDSREDYRSSKLHDTARRMRRGATASTADGTVTADCDLPYRFFQSTRRVKCHIVHFQLRNLLWATSSHDVVTMDSEAVVHWDCTTRKRKNILDVEKEGFPNIQVSTIIANEDLVVAGGFYGEVVLKQPSTGKLLACKRISYDDNAITNAFDIFDNTLMTSSNDCCIRTFDLGTLQKTHEHKLATAVNHATRQHSGKLVAAVGDDHYVRLIDFNAKNSVVGELEGHEEFSFATWWHPAGNLFCTGSQDKTARVWDTRHMKTCLHTLEAHGSEVRAVRFSNCGRYLAMAEEKDFVHVFNTDTFECAQEIDPFGEIAGISFSPDSNTLVVAVSHISYSSLIELAHSDSAQRNLNEW